MTGPAELTDADLADCVELFVEVFAAPPWDETWAPTDALLRLGDFLRTPRSRGVVVRDEDGALVGFALGHLERFGAEDHYLLKEMCVRPGAQRSGHGSALLAALADRMPDVTHWHLLTARDSPAAAFYVKHGFRPAGRTGVFVRP
jgi:GNAT superfamily N-acetyltransferase